MNEHDYTSDVPPGAEDFDTAQSDEPTAQNAEHPTGKGLRAELERQLARVKELEAQLDRETGGRRQRMMSTEVERLGLDPDHGIGKAISMTFDGEPEELAAFAEAEFDWTGPENPMARRITAEQSRLDEIGKAAGSVPVENPFDVELAKAEAAGDGQKTLWMKSQQLGRLLGH